MESNELMTSGLDLELKWLEHFIAERMSATFGAAAFDRQGMLDAAPELGEIDDYYAQFVKQHELTRIERLCFVLAATNNLRPNLLDPFLLRNKGTDMPFTEFSGQIGTSRRGFSPSCGTLIWLLSGGDILQMSEVYDLFEPTGKLVERQILTISKSHELSLRYDHLISVSDDIVDLVTSGKLRLPSYSADFPAEPQTTKLEWSDLVLEASLLRQLDHVAHWVNLDHNTPVSNVGKFIKPGYRCLFYGPPGTGKTLAATLLGKRTGRPVYRIDISQLVSKWVGETQKNLSKIFNRAGDKNWILFFDEADAVFGKRGQASGAQDRYANQDISYLLQRTETFPGLIILATNLKGNMDEAFMRRFQSVLYFAKPGVYQRLALWKNIYELGVQISNSVDVEALARKYDISGGGLVNVFKFVYVEAQRNTPPVVTPDMIEAAMKLELSKVGRTL